MDDDLLTIQTKLEHTMATIARLEPFMTASPDPDLVLSIGSLRQYQEDLERDFLKASDERGLDVCSYRLSAPEGQPKVDALSDALTCFQSLFSVTYDAIKNGPKSRKSLSAKVVAATSFRFGYTYPGSLGMVFTLPNLRLLPTLETELDISMATLVDLAAINSPDRVSDSVRKYGEAVIRATYKWAKALSVHALTASVEWIRDQETKTTLLIQQPESYNLYNVIEQSGAEHKEPVSVRGILVAVNTVRRTFHLVTDETETTIRGTYGAAISEEQKVTLPRRYEVTLSKTTTVQYSKEEPDVEYFLEGLKPL